MAHEVPFVENQMFMLFHDCFIGLYKQKKGLIKISILFSLKQILN